MLSIACPNCRKVYTIEPDKIGKKLACKCGARFLATIDDCLSQSPKPMAMATAVPDGARKSPNKGVAKWTAIIVGFSLVLVIGIILVVKHKAAELETVSQYPTVAGAPQAVAKHDTSPAKKVEAPKLEQAKTKVASDIKRVWADDILRDAWVLPQNEVEKKYADKDNMHVNVRGTIANVVSMDNGNFAVKMRLPDLATSTGDKSRLDKPRFVLCQFMDDAALSHELGALEGSKADVFIYGFFNRLGFHGGDPQPFTLLVGALEVETAKQRWKYDTASKKYTRIPK